VSPERPQSSLHVACVLCWPVYFDCSLVSTDDSPVVCVFPLWWLLLLTEKPNKMQQCIKILLFLILNEAQHVSGDTPPIIRSLKLHKQPLVLHNTVAYAT